MTDTTTLSGAQFRREVGTDPAKWAEAFVAAYAAAADEGLRADADRTAFAAAWLRDYADACVAEAVRRDMTEATQQPQQ